MIERNLNRETRSNLLDVGSNEFYCNKLESLQKEFLGTLTCVSISTYPKLRDTYSMLGTSIGVRAENILITEGAESAIRLILSTLKQEHNMLTVVEPTFGLAVVHGVNFLGSVDSTQYVFKDRFEIQDTLLNYIHDVVYIASPDNLTGYTFNESQIYAILNRCKCLILDESYSKLDFIHNLTLHDKVYVIKSLSKYYGAPGLRVGYILASEENIHKLSYLKPMCDCSSISGDYINFVVRNKGRFDDTINDLFSIKSSIDVCLRNYKVIPNDNLFSVVQFDESLTEKLDKFCKYRTFVCDGISFIRISANEKFIEQWMRTV